MKKKLLAIALAVALIAIMVSGTLAYFTAEDEVTNTFTIGSVDIEIYENGQETASTVVSFTEALVPIVDTETPSEDPGYAAKAVKVKSTGENAAFIRTHLAIPTALVDYLVLDVDTESGWTKVATTTATVEENGTNVSYTVYTYDYNTAVAPDGYTAELLKGVYLDPAVDIKDNPATDSGDLEFCKPNSTGGYTFSGFVAHSKTSDGYTSSTVSIRVYSQAIQSQGFSNATTALNSGFGANTNPWQ